MPFVLLLYRRHFWFVRCKEKASILSSFSFLPEAFNFFITLIFTLLNFIIYIYCIFVIFSFSFICNFKYLFIYLHHYFLYFFVIQLTGSNMSLPLAKIPDSQSITDCLLIYRVTRHNIYSLFP